MVEPWGELGAIAAERERLDARELALIDQARRAGATWSQVASALGLASRQAAEQRRQRLAVAVDRVFRSRQQELDSRYGQAVTALRKAVSRLCAAIRADGRWEDRFVRAELVRDTLTLAAAADPGPLFALAAQAAADLGQSGVEVLPGAVLDGVIELRRALKEAIPASGWSLCLRADPGGAVARRPFLGVLASAQGPGRFWPALSRGG